MEYHLDRRIRLHEEIEYKILSTWALSEVAESGASVSGNQIPWVWTLYFTAIECNLRDNFSIKPETGGGRHAFRCSEQTASSKIFCSTYTQSPIQKSKKPAGHGEFCHIRA